MQSSDIRYYLSKIDVKVDFARENLLENNYGETLRFLREIKEVVTQFSRDNNKKEAKLF